MNEASRLDRGAIETLEGMAMSGVPDLLRTIVSMFLDTIQVHLETLKQSAASNNPEPIRRVSHDLKSSSAVLGAVALAARCDELETLARSGTTRGAVELVRHIANEFGAVRPELEALLATPA